MPPNMLSPASPAMANGFCGSNVMSTRTKQRNQELTFPSDDRSTKHMSRMTNESTDYFCSAARVPKNPVKASNLEPYRQIVACIRVHRASRLRRGPRHKVHTSLAVKRVFTGVVTSVKTQQSRMLQLLGQSSSISSRPHSGREHKKLFS